MVACYAWTDIQIINMINVRLHFFDEEADLFVCMLKRVNCDLVEAIENSGYFRHIYRVPHEEPVYKNGVLEKMLPYYKGIRVSWERKKKYSKYYKKTISDTRYNFLLVPGYWGEALHLVRYLLKNNKFLKVAFVDEGARHYSATIRDLCQNQLDGGIRQKVIKLIIVGRYLKAVDRLPQLLFLYEPDAQKGISDINIRKIPKITPDNPLYKCLMQNVNKIDANSIYGKAKVIFFQTGENAAYGREAETTIRILNTIGQIIPVNQIIIRCHPTNQCNIAEIKEKYHTQINMDKGNFLFEAMVPYIGMERKVLISRNTSCFLTTKYMFDLEPVLIFVYRIYPDRTAEEEYDMKNYVDGLRQKYRDKWKIFDVESVEKLKEGLRLAYTNHGW